MSCRRGGSGVRDLYKAWRVEAELQGFALEGLKSDSL